MIKVIDNYINIEGKLNNICDEISLIYFKLIMEIGKEETIALIDMALDKSLYIVEKNDKILKKDIKEKIKEKFPKNIAETLCNLL